MQNKTLTFLLLLVSILPLACENKCPKESVNTMQNQFKTEYLAWKNALNFMDDEVIQLAYKKMDSTLQQMETCFTYPAELLQYADSVSHIYSHSKIDESALENANALIQTLDDFVEQQP